MRILLANTFYAPDVVGGAELSVQGIAEELVARGHPTAVLACARTDEDIQVGGVDVFRRRLRGLMSYPDHLEAGRDLKKVANKALVLDNPRNRPVIDECLARFRPDVVASNNLLGITPELWRRARAAGIPCLHTARDYALMCPNSTLMCPAHTPCVGTPRPACVLVRHHLRRASQLVATFTAPSAYALATLLDAGYFPHARNRVIANAIRFDETAVRQARERRLLAHAQGPLRVAYVGRLTDEKGFDLVLAATKVLRGDVELHVAGAGPLERQATQAAAAGMPITLHGFLSQDDLTRLLQECDVLVAPSRYAETFGRIVYDAWRSAAPAIVSDAGALPELVVEGTGRVVATGSLDALVEALGTYVEDRELARAQGARGALELLGHTIEGQTSAFLEEFDRLVGR